MREGGGTGRETGVMMEAETGTGTTGNIEDYVCNKCIFLMF